MGGVGVFACLRFVFVSEAGFRCHVLLVGLCVLLVSLCVLLGGLIVDWGGLIVGWRGLAVVWLWFWCRVSLF